MTETCLFDVTGHLAAFLAGVVITVLSLVGIYLGFNAQA
jgi:hypothetical protein